jgi:hypothetical protein
MQVGPGVSKDTLEDNVKEQGTKVCLDPKPHHIQHTSDTNRNHATPRTKGCTNPDGELVYTSAHTLLPDSRYAYSNVVDASTTPVPYGQKASDEMSNDNCDHSVVPDQATCNHRRANTPCRGTYMLSELCCHGP